MMTDITSVEQIIDLLNALTGEDSFAKVAAGLESRTRDGLLRELRERNGQLAEENIEQAVSEKLAALGLLADTKWVVFKAYDWTNGWFVEETGTIYLSDESTDDVEFDIDSYLTEAYGRVHSDFTVGVKFAGQRAGALFVTGDSLDEVLEKLNEQS